MMYRRERQSLFTQFKKYLHQKYLDLRLWIIKNLQDADIPRRDSISNSEPEVDLENIIYRQWTRKPLRRRMAYTILIILCVSLCFQIWRNLKYENVVLRDKTKSVILNSFGSSSYDFLTKSDTNLKSMLDIVELYQISEDSKSFSLGYIPVHIIERGLKNITFQKIFDDAIEESKKSEFTEGCFCASELGLGLDAIFVWKSPDPFDKIPDYLSLFSPKIIFSSDILYHGNYELGSFTCSEKIQVSYFSSTGLKLKETFSQPLSMCLCACNDFISKYNKPIKII